MSKYRHEFVEKYDGLIGFGLDGETDKSSFVCYLQMFSDDDVMMCLKERITDEEIEKMIDLIHKLMHHHFTEDEYHKLFLKDDHDH